jgi:TolB-like protein/DNA-binding winged helix-turn-helix (wHTH) protein
MTILNLLKRVGAVLRKLWERRSAAVSPQTGAETLSRRVLRAHPLTLDLADQRAWLDDRALDIGPKPFALLHALMQAPQRLVTKDELIESVWNGRFVSETVLTTAMRDLRRALGDDARTPHFIGTVHGRGYRFLLPVQEIEKKAAPIIARTPRRYVPQFAAAALIVVAGLVAGAGNVGAPRARASGTAAETIAVLPFEDLSPAGDQSYFSEGLSEEILNVLMGMEGLNVASRTSSFAFKDRTEMSAPEIARALNVRHVLEGSVRRAGDRVRISVQLIDANADRRLWAHTYERALSVENLFDVQDEVASAIARELEAELGPQRVEVRSAAAGTRNLRAYELYLRGRELFAARTELPRAVRFARASVEADPQFARGWELLAAASFAGRGAPTPEARDAVARALRLDADLSLAHAIKAVMENYQAPYDWAAAVSDLERAVELDPANTTALLWLAIEMHKLGYLERSQGLLDRCLAVDPAYDRCRLHLMWVQHMRGQTDAALATYRRLAVDGAHPDDTVLLPALLARGDIAGARAMAASVSDEQPMPAIVFEALRNPNANRNAARQALREWLDTDAFNPRDVYSVALALEAYDIACARQGSFFPIWLPDFPAYRQSAAFKQFVRDMRLDVYWRAHGFPPQCRAEGADDFSCA